MKIWFPAIKVGTGSDVFTRRLAEVLLKYGIETEITWFHKFFEFAPFMLNWAEPPKGIDIIHANSWNGFAFKRYQIPLVITEHHCVFDPMYQPYKNVFQHIYHQLLIKKFEMASFEKANSIIAVSEFTAASLKRSAQLDNTKYIYNWVDVNKFQPVIFKPDKAQPELFRLLFVGNTSRRKGFELLAPIIKRLGRKFELRFTTGLRSARNCNYPENMISLGRLSEEDLIKEYQQCDALLFPSRFEGFGYTLLEAMACGKPVIATNATSIPEVVHDGVTGILCPVDDVEAFVAACHKLAAEPDMCRRMSEAGRKRAVKMFSEDLIVTQYIDLYKSLL